MSIPLQNEIVVPNSVVAQQVITNTTPDANGKLKTSAHVTLAASYVIGYGTADEHWSLTGQTGVIYIPDIDNLDDDIAGLALQIQQAFGLLVSIIDALNVIRKVL